MKIFFPKEHYDKKYRGHVFPLLKPFLKNEAFTDEERLRIYGVSEKDFSFVENLSAADVAILPMSWNYYYKDNKTKKAFQFIEEVKTYNKKVLSVNNGDFGVKIPRFSNCITFRTSGYASKAGDSDYGIPVFIKDALVEIYKSTEVCQKEYQEKPVVGFCGQANQSLWNASKEISKTSIRNLLYFLGRRKEEPQQLISSSYIRAKILFLLKKSELIEDNFILRHQYRAGVKDDKQQHKTTFEFYENIKESDYVLCVRGAGNFSVRFYETLMMGRIPVYIHTDGLLPLSDQIDWKKHVVWIDYSEIDQIDRIIDEFHQKLNQEKLHRLFETNRKLWKEKLTLKGFFKALELY